jgi:predicted enzyme related to lactoylglutathione lyase
MAQAAYDRSGESLGNIVELAHVNVTIPDQRLSTLFYITGLGLTRDPYIMTGVTNMWVNVGKSQFHLPTGEPQHLRGVTGLVIPDRAALLERLTQLRQDLKDTAFSFREANDGVETTCPWGNRIVCHTPDEARFGRFQLAMPYVIFDVAAGTAPAIVRFYRDILGAPSELVEDKEGRSARIQAGEHQHLVFREADAPQAPYDNHHIQIYIADFGGPYDRLKSLGLVSEESNRVQYRFRDIIDLDTKKPIYTIEHEVRSLTHPLFGRALVNRDPALSAMNFRPGHEDIAWGSA